MTLISILGCILLYIALFIIAGPTHYNEALIYWMCVLLGLVPAIIAHNKGRSFGIWWIYGSGLFIVAIIHAIVIRPNEQALLNEGFKKCPFCAEMIKPDAKVCRYCGRDLPEATTPPTVIETTENLSPYQRLTLEERFNIIHGNKIDKVVGIKCKNNQGDFISLPSNKDIAPNDVIIEVSTGNKYNIINIHPYPIDANQENQVMVFYS